MGLIDMEQKRYFCILTEKGKPARKVTVWAGTSAELNSELKHSYKVGCGEVGARIFESAEERESAILLDYIWRQELKRRRALKNDMQ